MKIIQSALVSALLMAGLSLHHLSQAATSKQITKHDFRASVCNITELTISYTFDEAYSEPLISSKMKWLAGSNTSPNCLTKLTFIYMKIKKNDGNSKAAFSFNSLLEEAIDNTIQPLQERVTEAAIEEPEREKTSRQEQARLLALREQELAEEAKNNVVILINTKLAQYSTPASACESGRSVAS